MQGEQFVWPTHIKWNYMHTGFAESGDLSTTNDGKVFLELRPDFATGRVAAASSACFAAGSSHRKYKL